MARTKTLTALTVVAGLVAPPLARADELPNRDPPPARSIRVIDPDPPPVKSIRVIDPDRPPVRSTPVMAPPAAEVRPRDPGEGIERAPQWHLTAAIGGYGTSDETGGIMLDFLGLRRVGLLAFGLDLQLDFDGRKGESDQSVVLAPTLGIFAPTGRSVDVGVVASVGLRNHHVRDSAWFSDDPGASGMTGMFALRTTTAVCFGQKATRTCSGFSLFLDDDLARTTTPTYAYTQEGFFGGSSKETTSHAIGTLRFGGVLAAGATF
jgi:hypothetical protein